VTAALDGRLAAHVDVAASLAASRPRRPGAPWKPPADLDRYAQMLDADRPQVVVETGTHRGHFAAWLAARGVDVVTVDVDDRVDEPAPSVTYLIGSSVDPAVVRRVAELVAGRRCVVSLDSHHSADHVTAEIDLYGPLVTPGCHLVVEDTVWAWADDHLRAHAVGTLGTPLDAVRARLVGTPAWERDVELERAAEVSNAPAGWWVRRG